MAKRTATRKSDPISKLAELDYTSVALKSFIEDKTKKAAEEYGYTLIEPPIIEEAGLYNKFYKDAEHKPKLFDVSVKRSGKKYVVRPDLLPGVFKMYYENPKIKRMNPANLYFFDESFAIYQDSEIAKKIQSGFVSLGTNDYIYDVQIILTALRITKNLGIKDFILSIGSVGCRGCRKVFHKRLKLYLSSHSRDLCSECKKTYRKNPDSILKCVKEKCVEVRQTMPIIFDSLCSICKKNLTYILEFVEENNIKYELDPYKTKGEFWNRTIFHVLSKEGDILFEGGRIDNVSYKIMNRKLNSVGVFMNYGNVERILKKNQTAELKEKNDKVYIISVGDAAKIRSIDIMEFLHSKNIKAVGMFSNIPLNSKIDRVKRMGGRIVVIIGQKEAHDNTAILRDVITGEQEIVSKSDILAKLEAISKSKKIKIKNQ